MGRFYSVVPALLFLISAPIPSGSVYEPEYPFARSYGSGPMARRKLLNVYPKNNAEMEMVFPDPAWR